MTHTTVDFAGHPAVADAMPVTTADGRPGLLARLGAALATRRRRRADAAIERLICANGCVLTDELERRIASEYGFHAGGF